ncbi:MAG: amidohydrolase [Spirosomataceae bacterium]
MSQVTNISSPEFLRVTLVQTDIYWEDIPANLAHLEEKLAQLTGQTDLIILPEMFSTGFTMTPENVAEPLNLVTTRWMRQMALGTNAMILGSYVAREGTHFYNRLLAVYPDGTYVYYDKRHLFRMGGENEVYTPGKERVTLEWRGFKIRPYICYDLRFPVWSRNKIDSPYDLLVYVANWPSSRDVVWETLLRARAIENLAYVAGANRIGIDGNNVTYIGNSQIIDFKGQPLGKLTDKDEILTIALSKAALENFRTKFPAHLDADPFEILG